MAKYTIEYSKSVKKDLRKIDKSNLKVIVEKIYSLVEEPRNNGSIKLSGTRNLYRVRSGDYRIIYEIKDEVLIVLVVKIGHRKDVYK